MRIIVLALFIMAGVACLWAAMTGKDLYYGALGANKPTRPHMPMPRLRSRVFFTVGGIFFLFIAIWAMLHPR